MLIVNLIEESVIQINGETMMIVDVSVKNIMYEKKIMSETLPHVVVEIENMQLVLWTIQPLHVMKL